MQDILAFDSNALKARKIREHGSALGPIVYEATMAQRRIQDERHTLLVAELAGVNAELEALCKASGQRRAKSQAKIEALYATYLTALAEEATADSLAESPIAALRERSRQLQHDIRTIVLPRLTEREMNDMAIHNALNATTPFA